MSGIPSVSSWNLRLVLAIPYTQLHTYWGLYAVGVEYVAGGNYELIQIIHVYVTQVYNIMYSILQSVSQSVSSMGSGSQSVDVVEVAW